MPAHTAPEKKTNKKQSKSEKWTLDTSNTSTHLSELNKDSATETPTMILRSALREWTTWGRIFLG